jgi:uncharacterized protein YhaN
MKITDLHVDGFGVWSDLSVDDMSDQLTVFFGRNEAGKTTLMQCLRTVLYGFSPERRVRYVPPVHGGSIGGRVEIISDAGCYTLRRHLQSPDDPSEKGSVTLLARDGTTHGQAVLN